MPDLFYSAAATLQEQLELLAGDILSEAKRSGYRKKSFSLVFGDEKFVNNNVLIVQPPFTKKNHFEEPECEALINTLHNYKMHNYFITYAHLLALDRHTKDEIKKFGVWVAKLVEIIRPKMIIVLGEEAELTFLKRKCILCDFHGQEIGRHEDIPIYLGYPFSYFLDKSSYEDTNYKQFIHDTDWNKFQEEYKGRIKCQ